ncbi:MAG: HAD-IG family 5'-nucleotidase, partial [Actinobacteria bacterium]|nr:HAD-IG family 5'-nucleotidase [Actinomycetota bacterium]
LSRLDEEIGPLARAAGELRNEAWGPLMRSGNDKSLFARQVERYADVYTSRASNFLFETPYAFLRAARGSLPHDPS